MNGSVFVATNAQSKTINIKLNEETIDAMDELDARLEKLGGKLKLDKNIICEEALLAAIRKGNSELDKMEHHPAKGKGTEHAQTA